MIEVFVSAPGEDINGAFTIPGLDALPELLATEYPDHTIDKLHIRVIRKDSK